MKAIFQSTNKPLTLICFILFLISNLSIAGVLQQTKIDVLGIIVDVDTRPDVEGLQYTMTAIKDIPWPRPNHCRIPRSKLTA